MLTSSSPLYESSRRLVAQNFNKDIDEWEADDDDLMDLEAAPIMKNIFSPEKPENSVEEKPDSNTIMLKTTVAKTTHNNEKKSNFTGAQKPPKRPSRLPIKTKSNNSCHKSKVSSMRASQVATPVKIKIKESSEDRKTQKLQEKI